MSTNHLPVFEATADAFEPRVEFGELIFDGIDDPATIAKRRHADRVAAITAEFDADRARWDRVMVALWIAVLTIVIVGVIFAVWVSQ